MVEAIAADVEGEGITVQYGPAAVQWCSDPLLRQIAETSARSARRVHMHLLESRYQREWADRTFPQGIVRYLDDIGLLNDRLSLAHCTWLRPQEMELIAARGATIVVNTSSNLVLSSGVAPVGEMLRRGCRVAMGLDGLAVDEDEDALRELRLAYLLHKASGFDIRMRREDVLRMAFEHGRFAVTGMRDGGRVAVGAPADLLVLDWESLSRELVEPEVDAVELLLASARQEHVRQLLVAGREVVRDGVVTGVDLPALEGELLSSLRKAAGTTADIRAAMPELRAALRSHYREPLYCA
jgi:cytosine/adenosine deaminase-related metal-dependent hydrolase